MTFDSSEMRVIATRRLRYALAASLLLHILILASGGSRLPTGDAPGLLQATLRKPAQAAAEPSATKPLPPTAPAAPRPIVPPRPEPRVLDRPQAPSVPQGVAAPAEAVAKPGAASEPAPAAAVGPAAAGSATAGLLTEGNAGGDTLDGLRGYRLAVAGQARRFKRYPAQAMASGWAGTVEVRVEVGSDGRPRAATVARSSGHEVLDRAALTMIDAGALRARLPDVLRGKSFAVVLPVVFNLDDE